MKNDKYLKGLKISATCQFGSAGANVKKIQEWLCIHELMKPGIVTGLVVDGDFKGKTKTAVINFQKDKGFDSRWNRDSKCI